MSAPSASENHVPVDPRVWKGFAILAAAAVVFSFFSSFLFLVTIAAMAGQLAFFRNPERHPPEGDAPVSPADGKVVDIETCFEDRFLNEEAVRIGIFLSIFNVHVNRSPLKGIIRYQKYEPGKFLNALDAESARVNESNWIGIDGGVRKALVRQISGAIARKIFWDVPVGEGLERGAKFGIICYGSRAEVYVPKRLFRATVQIGQNVRAGETLLGEWLS
jgi:phosphatidylserine decarboxylase